MVVRQLGGFSPLSPLLSSKARKSQFFWPYNLLKWGYIMALDIRQRDVEITEIGRDELPISVIKGTFQARF